MLGGRRASQAAPDASASAELSVNMWAASDSSASEPDHQPASASMPAKDRVSSRATSRLPLAPAWAWWSWPWPCGCLCAATVIRRVDLQLEVGRTHAQSGDVVQRIDVARRFAQLRH